MALSNIILDTLDWTLVFEFYNPLSVTKIEGFYCITWVIINNTADLFYVDIFKIQFLY